LSGQPPAVVENIDGNKTSNAVRPYRPRPRDRAAQAASRGGRSALPRAVDLPSNTLKVIKLTFPGSVVALAASRRLARQAQSFA